MPFVCACLSYQLKLFMSSALRARPLIFYSKPSIALWNNLWQCLPNMGQGLKLELKFQIEISSFFPLKPQNKLFEVWILQSSYEYAQLNQKAGKHSDKFNAQFSTWWWGQLDNPGLWQYDLNVIKVITNKQVIIFLRSLVVNHKHRKWSVPAQILVSWQVPLPPLLNKLWNSLSAVLLQLDLDISVAIRLLWQESVLWNLWCSCFYLTRVLTAKYIQQLYQVF